MGTSSQAARGNRNQSGPRHSSELIEAARALWGEKLCVSETARRLGLTKNQLLGLAYRNEFPARYSLAERKVRIAAVRALWEAGYLKSEIARRSNMTVKNLRDMARQQEFPRR